MMHHPPHPKAKHRKKKSLGDKFTQIIDSIFRMHRMPQVTYIFSSTVFFFIEYLFPRGIIIGIVYHTIYPIHSLDNDIIFVLEEIHIS